MYNDTIKTANKIITYDDLYEIFAKMYEKIIYYKKINNSEELKNRALNYNHQNWTFKDSTSNLKFEIDFYDDTKINFDDYNNFISIFNSRLWEIKRIYAYLSLNYSTKIDGFDYQHYNQNITMWIYEDKVNITTSLSSTDKKIDDIYELIKSKILNAPERYDDVIKKKNIITSTVGFAIGFIPSLVISTLLCFVEPIKNFYVNGYVIFPIIVLILTFFIGNTIAFSILEKYYKNIMPEKKYAGYDSYKRASIYKDDIDKYVGTSEILIGKNMNNLECRKTIRLYRDKYKKWIPYELGILLLFSIIVLFI